MAKVKNPLMSFDCRGVVGKDYIFTKRHGHNVIGNNPVPSPPLTFLSLYHRWLYEDYAHLWKEQTPATQASYRSLGARCHLTAFQYWMSYQLTNLPDIGLWLRFDSTDEPFAQDYSRNHFDPSVIGAVPISGTIEQAVYCDGINDRIVATNTNLIFTDNAHWSIEFFATPRWEYAGWRYYLGFHRGTPADFAIHVRRYNQNHSCGFRNADGDWKILQIHGSPMNETHHYVISYDGTTMRSYYDGTLYFEIDSSFIGFGAGPGIIGDGQLGWAPMKTNLDNLVCYRRTLGQAEALLHAERRWPL